VHLDEITVIVGALGSITLTLILPPLLHNTVRMPGRLRRAGHWAMSTFWTVILVSHEHSSFILQYSVLHRMSDVELVGNWGSELPKWPAGYQAHVLVSGFLYVAVNKHPQASRAWPSGVISAQRMLASTESRHPW
jgi:hypothetical protein